MKLCYEFAKAKPRNKAIDIMANNEKPSISSIVENKSMFYDLSILYQERHLAVHVKDS